MRQLWKVTYQHMSNQSQELYLIVPQASALQGVVHNFVELLQWPNLQQLQQQHDEEFQDYPIAEVQFWGSGNMNDNDNKSKDDIAALIRDWDGCLVRVAFRDSTIITRDVTETNQLDPSPVITTNDYSDIVNNRTRAWVQRVLVKAGICPFTKSTQKSGQGLKAQGVPVGRIAYHHSTTSTATATATLFNAKTPDGLLSLLIVPLLSDTWQAMYEMLRQGPDGPDGVSSILLAAPEFDNDFAFWAGPVFALLEASVVAAQAESLLGVVCFHPSYAVSDGSTWPGFGHMHSVPRLKEWVEQEAQERQQQQQQQDKSEPPKCPFSSQEIAAGGAWQRRTPHATINVLRANQLAAAEQVRSSARLYPRNIRVLMTPDDPDEERTTNGMGGNPALFQALQQERNLGSCSATCPFEIPLQP